MQVKNCFMFLHGYLSGIFFVRLRKKIRTAFYRCVNMKHVRDAESMGGIYLIVILMIRNGL